MLQAQEANKGFYLKIAYAGGMITHPGFSVGAGYQLSQWTNTKRNGNIVTQDIRLGINLGTYFHKRMHTGIFITPNIEWIRTSPKGFQFGLNLSGGYLKTFVPNTFKVDGEGLVQKQQGSGTDHFIFMPGLRLGKDLSINGKANMEWFVNNQLMFQSPYFDKTNKYLLTEIGVNFKLQ